eukprot:COSAG06_NODE_28276_length_577_cov_1.071130_1_plen_52_part_10
MMIILPRQARDSHRKKRSTRGRFLAQYDADCELFEKIIFGDLCEETYYDQVR